mmetsp:Transcript_44634/g.112149  ORF Transcript_44634/g.112149 Transcript_44634/m.112149 type:complete len:248 (-) Transcript_44634:46-789(-)
MHCEVAAPSPDRLAAEIALEGCAVDALAVRVAPSSTHWAWHRPLRVAAKDVVCGTHRRTYAEELCAQRGIAPDAGQRLHAQIHFVLPPGPIEPVPSQHPARPLLQVDAFRIVAAPDPGVDAGAPRRGNPALRSPSGCQVFRFQVRPRPPQVRRPRLGLAKGRANEMRLDRGEGLVECGLRPNLCSPGVHEGRLAAADGILEELRREWREGLVWQRGQRCHASSSCEHGLLPLGPAVPADGADLAGEA